VLNPGGSVSPCCAVPSQKNDFGSLTNGGRFFDLWNNDTFRRARGLFAGWAKADHSEPDSEPALKDGMAVAATRKIAEDELICEKCPIPHMQNYTDGIIDGVIVRTARSFFRDKSPRQILNYLLMGAPIPSPALARRAMRRARRLFAS
jgi:hypothetical protein